MPFQINVMCSWARHSHTALGSGDLRLKGGGGGGGGGRGGKAMVHGLRKIMKSPKVPNHKILGAQCLSLYEKG